MKSKGDNFEAIPEKQHSKQRNINFSKVNEGGYNGGVMRTAWSARTGSAT